MKLQIVPLLLAASLIGSAAAHAQSGSMSRVPGPVPKPPKRSAPPREPSRDMLGSDQDDGWYYKRLACDSKPNKTKSQRKTCERGR